VLRLSMVSAGRIGITRLFSMAPNKLSPGSRVQVSDARVRRPKTARAQMIVTFPN